MEHLVVGARFGRIYGPEVAPFPLMSEHPDNSWPPLGDDGYSDEYGRIEPEIYETARRIWPEAERFAVSTLHDGAAGRTLLIRAAANVSRAYARRPGGIDSLKAYLFTAFKHLVLAELKKVRLHQELLAQSRLPAASLINTAAEELDKKILVEQLMQAMDEWTREVFELLVIGYSFEEIGGRLSMLGASVRNRYNNSIRVLIRRLHDDDRPQDGRD